MPAPIKGRAQHLDALLTGLAIFEAHINRDATAMANLTETTSPEDQLSAVLEAMELMLTFYGVSADHSPGEVMDSVRRRVIIESVKSQPGGK